MQVIPAIAAAANAAYAATVNFVTSAAFAVGAGKASFAIATATVNFAINAAVAFGINAIARQGIPDAEFAASNRKQAIPDRLSGYGRARLGGAFMLWEASGFNALNVLALHDGRVDGFEDIYLNDGVVTIRPDGYVQSGSDLRYGKFSDLVQIDTRVGLPTETRYSQITDFSLWPADARGDGIASLMMIAKSQKQEHFLRDYPNGLPLPSAVTRMQICYDARLGARDNPLAWAWTRNPVWQLLDYMTNPNQGMGLDYTQYFAPNIASWIASADVCDEPVPLAAGGTVPRYTGDGTYLHSTPPADVIATILACMDGWIAQDTGGAFILDAGKYTAPTVTITDAHIVSMDRQFYLEDERAVNELVISYTSPEYDYTEVEALPWRDEADILDRNGSVRSQRMSLPWVSTNSQARRLAKIAMAKATAPIRGTITTDLYGLKAYGQRRIRIQSPADSVVMADIVVDIVSVTLNSDFTLTIPFVATNAASYDWDAATEEDSQPTIIRPSPSDIATPVLLSATYDSATSRIEVIVAGPVDEAYEYQLSWKAQDGDPPQQIEYPVPIDSGANLIVYTTPTVPTGEIIDVQVAFISSSGAVGEYSNTISVPTAGGVAGSLNVTEEGDTVLSSGSVGADITATATIAEAGDTVTSAATAGAAYATWNPADKSGNIVLSGGNLVATSSGTGLVRGTISKSSGLYKYEVIVGSFVNPTGWRIGLARATASLSAGLNSANTIGWDADGNVFDDGGIIASFDSYSPGDTLSIEVDIANQQVFLQRLGGARSSAYNIIVGPFFPAFGPDGSGNIVTANFGASAWAIPATSGYQGWS